MTQIRPIPISEVPYVAIALIEAITGRKPRFAAVTDTVIEEVPKDD